MTPQLGPAGRGGARRRTRRRMNRRQTMTQPETSQSTSQESNYTNELEKLGKLHKEGVLTDEEFAAKKKEILG